MQLKFSKKEAYASYTNCYKQHSFSTLPISSIYITKSMKLLMCLSVVMFFAYSLKQYARGWLCKKVLILTYVTMSSLKDTVKYNVTNSVEHRPWKQMWTNVNLSLSKKE